MADWVYSSHWMSFDLRISNHEKWCKENLLNTKRKNTITTSKPIEYFSLKLPCFHFQYQLYRIRLHPNNLLILAQNIIHSFWESANFYQRTACLQMSHLNNERRATTTTKIHFPNIYQNATFWGLFYLCFNRICKNTS